MAKKRAPTEQEQREMFSGSGALGSSLRPGGVLPVKMTLAETRERAQWENDRAVTYEHVDGGRQARRHSGAE